eukprot:9473013-Pyramimonas_sp.AAC.2
MIRRHTRVGAASAVPTTWEELMAAAAAADASGRKRAITIDMLARMAPIVRATRKEQPKLATKLGA